MASSGLGRRGVSTSRPPGSPRLAPAPRGRSTTPAVRSSSGPHRRGPDHRGPFPLVECRPHGGQPLVRAPAGAPRRRAVRGVPPALRYQPKAMRADRAEVGRPPRDGRPGPPRSGGGHDVAKQQRVDVAGVPRVCTSRAGSTSSSALSTARARRWSRSAGRAQRAFHSPPQQLVAVRDAGADRHQDAGGDALVQRCGQTVERRRVGAGGHHGDQAGDLPGRLGQPRQPGQHEILQRRRDTAVLGSEELGEQERVSPGEGEELSAVAAGFGRLGRHALGGQRLDRYCLHDVAGQRGEGRAERVLRSNLVVAVGQDHHGGQVLDPPAEKDDQVRGRFVGPVHILDDQDPAGPWPRPLSSSISAANRSDWLARASSRCASAPPACRAMSCNGPDARGVPGGRTAPRAPAPAYRRSR